MVQLYRSRDDFDRDDGSPNGVSQIERYLEDKGFLNPDPVIRVYGKYCSPREYLFRSYVYRLVALGAIARKFESQAFYIDSQFAHPKDFEFLKFSKAFLWALTTSDLPDDSFPGQDHIPNDELRRSSIAAIAPRITETRIHRRHLTPWCSICRGWMCSSHLNATPSASGSGNDNPSTRPCRSRMSQKLSPSLLRPNPLTTITRPRGSARSCNSSTASVSPYLQGRARRG
jgi:hypothetical protein